MFAGPGLLLLVAIQAPGALPACDSVFAGLVAKTEANYAGFHLEYRGARRAAYAKRVATLAAEARRTTGDDCYFVLRAYTEAFADPHLFVFQSTYRDSSATAVAAKARTPERLATTEAEARTYFQGAAGKLDPLEGIWSNGALRVAIVADSTRQRGRFAAVVLTADTSLWSPGEVRARFTRRADGGYDAALEEANLARRFSVARIYKRNLLRFDPGMWAREFPVNVNDSGLVSLKDPHLATLVWRGPTPVLSIPSHDPTYRGTLGAILRDHREALAKAPRMIIDVRGNEGGASFVTNGLIALIAGPKRPTRPGPPQDGFMLSSPDQIGYAQTNWQNIASDSASGRRLAERLAAHPGELVSLTDSIDAAHADPPAAEPAPAGPRLRVGVLVDRGTVSAAEVFLRRAMGYSNVVAFGEPTAGALDYQTVQIVRIGDTGRRWYLGYPTITASNTLPAGGIRGKGIAPDRRVDWAKIADPIGFVDRALTP